MTGPWIDNDKRSLVVVNHGSFRRLNPDDAVIHGMGKFAAIHDQLEIELQHMRNRLLHVLQILVTALAHHITVQHRPLAGIDHVFHQVIESDKWVVLLFLRHCVLLGVIGSQPLVCW